MGVIAFGKAIWLCLSKALNMQIADSLDSGIPPLGVYPEKIIRDAAKRKKKKSIYKNVYCNASYNSKKNQNESTGTVK